MSEEASEVPSTSRCRVCRPEMNRTLSDTNICNLCKDSLKAEQSSEESLSILNGYRNAMEVRSSTYTDFISCDRAGRRNAVHDIQRDATTISMRKLTEDISELTIEGEESEEASTSSESDPGARPKEEESKPSP